jgi:hypothetical protein
VNLCYVDESGVPEIPGNTSHFILAGLSEHDFKARRMMVILCDRYGNEKKLVFEKKDFTAAREGR